MCTANTYLIGTYLDYENFHHQQIKMLEAMGTWKLYGWKAISRNILRSHYSR